VHVSWPVVRARRRDTGYVVLMIAPYANG
jgi:hypothetical protein